MVDLLHKRRHCDGRGSLASPAFPRFLITLVIVTNCTTKKISYQGDVSSGPQTGAGVSNVRLRSPPEGFRTQVPRGRKRNCWRAHVSHWPRSGHQPHVHTSQCIRQHGKRPATERLWLRPRPTTTSKTRGDTMIRPKTGHLTLKECLHYLETPPDQTRLMTTHLRSPRGAQRDRPRLGRVSGVPSHPRGVASKQHTVHQPRAREVLHQGHERVGRPWASIQNGED